MDQPKPYLQARRASECIEQFLGNALACAAGFVFQGGFHCSRAHYVGAVNYANTSGSSGEIGFKNQFLWILILNLPKNLES